MHTGSRIKEEIDPISDDEWLLRRIRFEKFRSDKTPVISPNSFEPRLPRANVRDPDLTGISLYREACLANAELVLAKAPIEKWNEFGIVRIPMSLLTELGLTAIIEPDKEKPTIPGHIVVPEINAESYVNNKARMKPILLRLAEVSSENIVRTPSVS